MNNNYTALFAAIWFLPLFIFAAAWTLTWKGLALYRAAQNRSPVWFIVLLLVNTLGVLEIIYYFAISKKPTPKS